MNCTQVRYLFDHNGANYRVTWNLNPSLGNVVTIEKLCQHKPGSDKFIPGWYLQGELQRTSFNPTQKLSQKYITPFL